MADAVNLYGHLVTVLPLDAPQQLAGVLTRLCGHVPLSQPYYLGEEDPPKASWDLQTVTSVTGQIVSPSVSWYHWQRGGGQESGRVSRGSPYRHGVIRIKAEVPHALVTRYVHFIREESLALKADLAFIHVTDGDRPLSQDEPEYAMRFSQSTVLLRRGLPELPWATVFGQSYVDMFGREKLLSTPAAELGEMGSGSIYVQLTETCEFEPSAEFERIRQAAKAHLGLEAFWGSGKARVPEFNLLPTPGPQTLGVIDGLPVTGMIAGKPIVQTENGPRVIDVPFKPRGAN